MTDSLDRAKQNLDRMDAALRKSMQRKHRDTLKQQLLRELESASDATLEKTLDFVQFLIYEERELAQDLSDARAAIEEAQHEGTVSLADLKRELGL